MNGHRDLLWQFGIAIGAISFVGLIMFILTRGLYWGPPLPTTSRFDGAVVVRVCRDGTWIYRLANGEYATGGFGAKVADPETVCAR